MHISLTCCSKFRFVFFFVQDEYREMLENERSSNRNLNTDKEKLLKHHTEMRNQMELDIDKEVEQLKQALTLELERKQAENETLHGEYLVLEKALRLRFSLCLEISANLLSLFVSPWMCVRTCVQ